MYNRHCTNIFYETIKGGITNNLKLGLKQKLNFRVVLKN